MKIDTNIWVTQQALADELMVPIQTVHNWVQRKKINTLLLPGNTTLVNKYSININTSLGRPRKTKSTENQGSVNKEVRK